MKALLAVGVPALLVVSGIGAGMLAMTPASEDLPACAATSGQATAGLASVPGQVAGWGHDQLVVAAQIINAGASIPEVTYRDQQIGVMTAMGESGLRALAYGDWETGGVRNPDGTPTSSLGVFQQQKWWGTVEQRMDPYQSAQLFFAREAVLAGRDQMTPGQVAYKIQVGGSPSYYQGFWADAQAVVAALAGAGTAAVGQGSPGAGSAGWVVPLAVTWVETSPFGYRVNPISGVNELHSGLDMAAPTGSQVLAAAAGQVTVATDLGNRSYGRYVKISHPDGIDTIYGHMSQILVHEGQTVTAGQVIGLVGATGNATGPHLHFEVRVNAQPVDPIPFMSSHGVILNGTAGQPGTAPTCQQGEPR